MVSFAKSTRAVAGTQEKFPALTYRWHCISGNPTPMQELMLTHSHMLYMNDNKRSLFCDHFCNSTRISEKTQIFRKTQTPWKFITCDRGRNPSGIQSQGAGFRWRILPTNAVNRCNVHRCTCTCCLERNVCSSSDVTSFSWTNWGKKTGSNWLIWCCMYKQC